MDWFDRRNPHEKGGMASVYGMAAAVTGGKEADHRAMEINRLDTQGPSPLYCSTPAEELNISLDQDF